ncbi:rho guanine nucleotide exchange factor 7-like isoform X3 [Actinia tenebrosa]|uniref:Rho guanine nucleotide exchange factor 7-like isoform X3 n=1 Tax=Actinia tenebrosa TaxID=6105 RepID=A0A6P8IPT8_ACTTE|nr:rho guanine nucleotide exchange factor 7-like isoform X3 [Actinia tenebrosa]
MEGRVQRLQKWFLSLGLLNGEEHGKNVEKMFVETLLNGVVLCQLINKLNPGVIEKIHEPPTTEQERFANLEAFLRACQEIGVKSEEVFAVNDLESEGGYEKVLRTLESLESISNGHGFATNTSRPPPLPTQIDGDNTGENSIAQIAEKKEMTDYGGGVRLVKATFPFQGTDDDEICFVKGDILEVTKVVDGGWWEGTINGKYGWFPSNYVQEISSSPEVPVTPTTPSPDALSANKRDSTRVYHNLVVQNILDTERAHVSELQALLQNYLKPLKFSNVLSSRDLKVLCGNFEELVKFQQNLFSIIDECAHQPLSTQRIAANFLQIAPQMKELYLTYCANHPRAVEILTKYSDELSAFIESKGAPAPGILTLTTSLSKPFRHLDKYPTLLLELERHLEDGHIDQLDTKKAIAVFQNIKTSCTEMRKKKETELEILTGDIEGLDKEELAKFGECLLVSQFLIHGNEGEVKERYFLLFPSYLVILQVSPRLNGFCYEKKHDLSRVSLRSLEDTEGILNAFEIKASGEVMKISTNHAPEKAAWLETVSELVGIEPSHSTPNHSPKSLEKTAWDSRFIGKTDKTSDFNVSPTGLPKRSNSTSLTTSHQPSTEIIRSMSTSHSANTDLTSLGSPVHSPLVPKRWDFSKLRPTPPLRPAYALAAKEHDTSMGRSVKGLLHSNKKKQDFTILQCLPLSHGRTKSEATDEERHSNLTSVSGGSHVLEEDMLILRVIEAYCTSARARQTLNSSPIAPEIPAHAPRAMSTSSLRSDWKRKSKKKQNREGPDDYNCLKKKVEHLQYETMSLRESLAEEQMARRKMEKFIRTSLKGIVPDLKWEEFKDET